MMHIEWTNDAPVYLQLSNYFSARIASGDQFISESARKGWSVETFGAHGFNVTPATAKALVVHRNDHASVTVVGVPRISMVFLFRLLGRLPLGMLHVLGALAGWAIYLLSPTYRRHLRETVRQAGLDDRVQRAAVGAAGKQMLELTSILSKTQAEASALVVEVRGWEHVEAAQRAGKGIIFLTPHLGCFEITAQYYSGFGDITVLYRAPRQQRMLHL